MTYALWWGLIAVAAVAVVSPRAVGYAALACYLVVGLYTSGSDLHRALEVLHQHHVAQHAETW